MPTTRTVRVRALSRSEPHYRLARWAVCLIAPPHTDLSFWWTRFDALADANRRNAPYLRLPV